MFHAKSDPTYRLNERILKNLVEQHKPLLYDKLLKGNFTKKNYEGHYCRSPENVSILSLTAKHFSTDLTNTNQMQSFKLAICF